MGKYLPKISTLFPIFLLEIMERQIASHQKEKGTWNLRNGVSYCHIKHKASSLSDLSPCSYKVLKLLYYYYYYYVHVCMCVLYTHHSIHVKFRGQLFPVSSLLPPWVLRINLGWSGLCSKHPYALSHCTRSPKYHL